MDIRTELSEFLKSRRARLRPEDVGLRDFGGVRRVAGLRREELALAAGVSIAHYTRLEQGNGQSVSDEVLDAVSAALRLDPDESKYLRQIARRPTACEFRQATPDSHRGARYLLDSLEAAPAFMLGRHTQIVGWNPLAVAVFGDFPSLPEEDRTLTHLLFTDPYVRELHRDGWERAAREHVAHLRTLLGHFRADPKVIAHIERMRAESADFARLWGEYLVGRVIGRVFTLHHPVAGELRFYGERIMLPDEPACCSVDVYATEPGSDTARALLELARESPAPSGVR
ncbi:helix-turn-helix domain-containing protein [Glycomyces artemisiae]|uniref:Helix-turn-helix protein n=1 Tax=Glycomyces artemisiae TaxID=1076443 RepID=A0A2T0UHA4_9ACTN|nr:helix-turn-helix transcriptional regulator [Glycomyces artemisiae]PRY57315.1 helix-turn-helix protein [Glycomyces artemisiae]